MTSSETAKPRIRMLIPIWGPDYIERWLDLCFATLRAEGNIPYLNEHADFELAILTKEADVGYMQAEPRFTSVTEGIRVRFVTMDEFFPPQGNTPYGVPLTLAYAKGIQDLGEQAIGTYIILLNADIVVASGSFRSFIDRIHAGYTVIGGSSLRAIDGGARTALYEKIDRASGILSITPREAMALVNADPHATITSRTLNESGPIDTHYFHQMFWRVTEDCIAMRAFLIHPYCFRIEKPIEKVLCPVDYGFIADLCPDGRLCVLDDSDDFMVMELQALDSEGYQLRLAKKGETPDQRMARLATEIVTHAATWTTAAHRRFAKYTILFHTKDLPADIAERIAPFEAFVDGILDKLPPPASHIGHFQWLPAVYYYRQDMIRGGGDPNVALLDDPRNDMPPPASPPQAQEAPAHDTSPEPVPISCTLLSLLAAMVVVIRTLRNWTQELVLRLCPAMPLWLLAVAKALVRRPRNWVRALSLSPYRNRLAEIVESRLATNGPGLDVVYIDHINNHVKPPPAGTRVFDFGNPTREESGKDFTVEIPPRSDARLSDAVVIYAPTGFLALWSRPYHDAEAILAEHRQLVLVLIQQNFIPLSIPGHSYMLAVLQSCFPASKYDVTVDVYLAPESTRGKIALARLAWNVTRSLAGRRRPFQPNAVGDAPDRFSALVISARQRPLAERVRSDA